MEKIYKRCLVISLLMCASFCITLVVADIHEGTGDLTGLGGFYCGECIEDGDKCEEAIEDECGTPFATQSGPCPTECDGAGGYACDPNDDAGGFCKNGSGTCTDSEQAPCVWGDVDDDGLSEYYCDDPNAEPYDCGEAYNKCVTP